MTGINLLALASVALGMIGVFVSARSIIVQKRAEAGLVQELIQKKEFVRLVVQIVGKDGGAQTITLDTPPTDLERARRVIELAVKELDPGERRTIEEALHQPSLRGRERYIEKLVGESARELQLQEA